MTFCYNMRTSTKKAATKATVCECVHVYKKKILKKRHEKYSRCDCNASLKKIYNVIIFFIKPKSLTLFFGHYQSCWGPLDGVVG